ncbi:YdcF family protein [Nocardia asteroides]|uniref:YdcF family protein n=1 Tax=Nocardia asteroides TaxID=1824 RepID=UPI001E5A2844|nr:YdcF family protein [Nocardia asteroides]UGT58318.1 YdcF family protein [Nocardia asteroides]
MRRSLLVLGALLLTALIVAVALWPVYVRPRTDEPVRADAILVLGGAHDGREELGLQLAAAGYAPRVLISNPYERSPLVNRICHGGYSFEVVCFDPSPRTTLGEGRELARLGVGWTRVIVVTFTPHISRSRYILGKCWPGELLFADPKPHLSPARWAWDYAYQSAGYVKAWFQDC